MGGDWFSDSIQSITGGKEALNRYRVVGSSSWENWQGLRRADVDVVKHFVAKKRRPL